MFMDFLKLEFEKPDLSIVFNNESKINTEELKCINFVLGDSIGFSYKGIYHEFVVEHKWGNKAYFVSKLPLEQSNHSGLYNVLSEIREYFPAKLIEVMAKTTNKSDAATHEHEDLFIPCLKNIGVSIYGAVAEEGDDSCYALFNSNRNRRKGEQWWLDDFMKSITGILVSSNGMANYAHEDTVCGVVVAFAIDFEPMWY